MKHPVIDSPLATHSTGSPAAFVCQRNAAWLGYAGLIPFVVLATMALFSGADARPQAHAALVAYGAVIISFLGAWHWHAAIYQGSQDATLARMSFAVSPALLGWVALLLPESYGMALVTAGLLMTCFADSRWYGVASWYRSLRWRLTTVATLCMMVALFSAVLR